MINRLKTSENFHFDEGEKYLKRNHAAWLVRDDTFVRSLKEGVGKMKNEKYGVKI